MPYPKLKRDWKGLKVKTLVPLQNGAITIERGTILTVVENHNGLKLHKDPCPHCGVGVFITKVPEYDVVIVEEDV
jgi:hypothetical protein